MCGATLPPRVVQSEIRREIRPCAVGGWCEVSRVLHPQQDFGGHRGMQRICAVMKTCGVPVQNLPHATDLGDKWVIGWYWANDG